MLQNFFPCDSQFDFSDNHLLLELGCLCKRTHCCLWLGNMTRNCSLPFLFTLLEASSTRAMKQLQNQNLSVAKKQQQKDQKRQETIIRKYFIVVLVTSTIEASGFWLSQFRNWRNAILKAIDSHCLPQTDECVRWAGYLTWIAPFLVVGIDRFKV